MFSEDQPPDFKLELTIYCRRMDENANSQTLSRSMSKSVANSLVPFLNFFFCNVSLNFRNVMFNRGILQICLKCSNWTLNLLKTIEIQTKCSHWDVPFLR